MQHILLQICGGDKVIRLICKECNKIWYTANTQSGQRCDDCGGELEESEEECSEMGNN